MYIIYNEKLKKNITWKHETDFFVFLPEIEHFQQKLEIELAQAGNITGNSYWQTIRSHSLYLHDYLKLRKWEKMEIGEKKIPQTGWIQETVLRWLHLYSSLTSERWW